MGVGGLQLEQTNCSAHTADFSSSGKYDWKMLQYLCLLFSTPREATFLIKAGLRNTEGSDLFGFSLLCHLSMLFSNSELMT